MVKRFVVYVQFNSIFTVLTTSMIETTPQYIIIAIIILAFIFLLGVLGIIFYYIHRKYKSIDNHTNKKYQNYSNSDENKKTDTYKEDIKSYKNDVSDLGANTLPDSQTVVNMANKIVEFVKRK